MLQLLLLLLTFLMMPALASNQDFSALEKEGTRYRLQGDFEAAARVQDELIARIGEPVGHVFALNTIVTHLTWDESLTHFDKAIEHHTSATLDWCQEKLEDNPRHTMANYYCGQAEFTLAYYRGLRGSYFQAGRHGTRSIDYLEAALKQSPDLIDAKMHLGVAYYVADNLPPFIKLFSRVLWFIPTGNSEKSLPYIRDVIENGDHYPEVARYIFSSLAFSGADELKPEARSHLEHLVTRYPTNGRFQLRLLSLLLIDEAYGEMVNIARAFLDRKTEESPEHTLVRVMMVRAHLEMNELSAANDLYEQIDPLISSDIDDFPDWTLAWHLLASGQLHDLSDRREQAISTYQRILSIARSTYVNELIQDAAQKGLDQPYTLKR